MQKICVVVQIKSVTRKAQTLGHEGSSSGKEPPFHCGSGPSARSPEPSAVCAVHEEEEHLGQAPLPSWFLSLCLSEP